MYAADSNYMLRPLRLVLSLCSIDDWIEQNLGTGKVLSRNQVSSSSWSSAYVYETESGTKYFVKQSGRGADEGMFKGEALGLQAMYGKCCAMNLLWSLLTYSGYRAAINV